MGDRPETLEARRAKKLKALQRGVFKGADMLGITDMFAEIDRVVAELAAAKAWNKTQRVPRAMAKQAIRAAASLEREVRAIYEATGRGLASRRRFRTSAQMIAARRALLAFLGDKDWLTEKDIKQGLPALVREDLRQWALKTGYVERRPGGMSNHRHGAYRGRPLQFYKITAAGRMATDYGHRDPSIMFRHAREREWLE